MKCNRVLITGSTGLLGTAVVEAFRLNTGAEIVGVGHHELDITDADHVASRISGFSPDLVINCAAYTKVDDCETNEELARRVNGEGAGIVARAAAEIGADLIHISTDYVFNGSATSPIRESADPAAPEKLSAYGRSKLLGEQRVRNEHPGSVIVRTAWLFGHVGPCFPRAILDRARSGLPLRVVSDQIGAPTFAPDLAQGLVELAQHQVSGTTYHFTNAGECTWHAYAGEVLSRAGIIANVEAVSSEELGRPARRPKYSVLDMSQYVADTGHRPRHWRDALDAYFRG